MSNLNSKYSIDLIINDDKSRNAIQSVNDELKKISKAANMEEAQKNVLSAMKKMYSFAQDASLDFDKISKGFSETTENAIKELSKQAASLQSELRDIESLEHEKRILEYKSKSVQTDEEREEIFQEILKIDEKISASNRGHIESELKKNQQLRFQLKAMDTVTKKANYIAKSEDMQARLKQIQNVADSRSMKERMKFWTKESKQWRESKKARDEEIKSLKEKIKLLDQEDKKQNNIIKAMKTAGSITKAVTKGAFGVVGTAGKAIYTGTGIAGGATRMIAGGMRAGIGMLGAGLSAATQAADREVEKEHQANRIKGFSGNEAKNVLNEMYIRTGADYSQIVDAINRVQTTLKGAAKDEILSAAEIEMRYPGMSAAFASTNTASNAGNFNIYANRMKAIQKATSATDEQIQSSTQMFANMKPSDFGNAKVTELQAVYLGLQGSGAFESQEELDYAFRRFVRSQRNSNENVAEAAKNFKWSEMIRNDRNRLQASNTLGGMDWSEIINLTETKDSSEMQKTESEQMAANMRRIEEQKNKLLMTLIPAAIPLVEAFAKMLDGGGAKLIADGLNSLFTLVVPVLLKVLNMLNDYILTPLLKAINVVVEWIGDKSGVDTGAIPQNANGGIAIGPSIVGERSFQPEMILPLDYSRASRAGNIIQNVAQTFNMSGSETTALSLAQAVKSRDFRRATSQNAFITSRSGAF